jgi:hypothetical protein
VPVAVLAYPIFDITFVSVTRYARGQSLTQGGKDHTSHRLARIQRSDRLTAVAIYVICGALGLLAMVLQSLAFPPGTVVALFGVFFAFLAFGVRLARRAPVDADSGARGISEALTAASLVPEGGIFELRGNGSNGENGHHGQDSDRDRSAEPVHAAGTAPPPRPRRD